MAKKGSKKSGKDKPQVGASAKPVATPTTAAKMPSGVRKQLRRLERQLADAARQERKRVRKLERARHRRQFAEAALAELRAVVPTKSTAATPSSTVKTTTVAPARMPKVPAKARTAAAGTAAAAPARPRTAASGPARPRTARPAASPRRTAPKPPPATPPAASKERNKP